jgi:hypothetical protein
MQRCLVLWLKPSTRTSNGTFLDNKEDPATLKNRSRSVEHFALGHSVHES